jgi:uncharacterized coiled-coil protein SlyX
MTTEERVTDLENKVAEQQNVITELYKAVINQQQMINDRLQHQNELEKQIRILSETVLLMAKRP